MTAGQQRIDLVRHLEYFVAVADELHFGRAADAVGVSQPPLSQGLRRLERKLGSELFDRSSRGVALTDVGVALLPHARRILADVALLASAADDARREPVGFRLGVPPQMPVSAVAALVTAARQSLPRGRVDHTTAPTTALLQALLRGGVDAAVIVHPAPVSGLLAGPVSRMPGRALVASDHPLAVQHSTEVSLQTLARSLPLALPPRQHHPAAHDHLLDASARYGVRLSPRVAEDDRAAILAAASGTVAALTADPDLRSASVVNLAITGDPLPLRLRLVRAADTDVSAHPPAVDAVQSRLTAMVDQLR
ncbi:LysR family transcriptional regulator [Mycolicibacterium sp. P1-18]|uniref:LysR family transcriptional regulator n=1 Tax=Mycolicibacterium sp. P1-18 TaxID=2024615 RepID=UPI00156543E1|nr:LysR family transcriptional regulator [Mycolicibacterium sp. P1-18]